MIPPITNALIADIIQTTDMTAAGQTYWRQGRVSALEIDADLALISAEVRGGAARPYEVTILFPVRTGRAVEALIDCSCSVGFDCKHGAAVLFAAQAQQSTAPGTSPHLARIASQVSTRPVPLTQPLLQWLAEAQSEVQAAKRSVFDLVYVFVPRALHDGTSKKGKALPAAGEPLALRLAVLDGDFVADAPNRKWAGDISPATSAMSGRRKAGFISLSFLICIAAVSWGGRSVTG